MQGRECKRAERLERKVILATRFSGQVAVVTGAAGGIGRALALGIAREGADVACLDLSKDGAEATATAVRALGRRAVAEVCDAALEDEVVAAFERIGRQLGPIGVVLASAGGSRGESVPFLEMTVERWRLMLDRNLTSVFVTGLVAARHMAEHGGGAIVIVSSQLSEVVRPGMAHYCTAKGGVRQLIKSMAVDLIPYGIRVNGIAPGPTMTPGNRAWFERADVAAANERAIPLGRIAEPDEIVGGALYLASAEASFTVGATLMADGGYTLT
jgi:NAD(P)-dependent dehydrogenase (short-subunit alcohol dehydrogenase family)